MNVKALIRSGALALSWCLLTAAPARAAFDETPAKVLHKHGAQGLAFSADGTKIYAAMADGIAVLDAATAKQEAMHPLKGTASRIFLVGDGTHAVTSTDASQLVDLATGKSSAAGAWFQLYGCGGSERTALGVAFPAGNEGAMVVVDPATGQAGRTVFKYNAKASKNPGVAAVDRECKRLAVQLPDGGDRKHAVVTLFDVATGKKLGTVKHDGPLTALGWSWDGKQLFVGNPTGRVVRVDATTGKTLRKSKVSDDLIGTLVGLPDGGVLVGGTEGGKWLFKVLAADKDEVVQELPRAGCGSHMETALSPDGKRLAATCNRYTDMGVGAVVLVFQSK